LGILIEYRRLEIAIDIGTFVFCVSILTCPYLRNSAKQTSIVAFACKYFFTDDKHLNIIKIGIAFRGKKASVKRA
ncbi:MAG: hypothetical protein IKJ35_09210, partial [Clostridia bacterium]|nr:hypothetical protein [Clostridia bacterium]